MLHSQDLFPVITTKKIHITTSTKKIKVDFCLDIPNNERVRQSYETISEILYFYFLVLDDSNSHLLASLRNLESRESTMKAILRGEIQQRGRAVLSLGQILRNQKTHEFFVKKG